MGPEWFLPPEVVAGILETSDPSSVVASIATWLAEAIHHELAMGFSLTNIAATLSQFVGVGGAAYGVTGSELNFAGLEPLAAHCMKMLALGQAVVEANTLARSTVIPSMVCQGNRDEFVLDNALNVPTLGAYTPRIAELQAEYTEYWGQNSQVGTGYGGVLQMSSAGAAVPPPFTPVGASPAAPATAGEDVAQSVANTGGQASTTLADGTGKAASAPTDMMSQVLQPAVQAATSATEPAKDLFTLPMQAVQNISQSGSFLQNFGSMLPAMSGSNAAAVEAAATAAAPASTVAGVTGGLGAQAAGGAGVMSAGYSSPGVTTYTRPASTFGGRPASLRAEGLLNAAEIRPPTTTSGMGGAAMPMSPGGMLARPDGGSEGKKDVTHARIIVGDHGRRDA